MRRFRPSGEGPGRLGRRQGLRRFGPKDLISNYDALPTWNSASIHTIRLRTPQNRSCNSCHGRKELFLTKDDLKPGDPKANLKVIVGKIPPRIKK
ncbi:MAG: hypothetical protein M0Z48_00345 [Nitrospiraceae bacterium]|nr:hypothetical protein [Nitrospiraceae bacterium]